MKIRRVPLLKPDPEAQFRPEDFNDLQRVERLTCGLLSIRTIPPVEHGNLKGLLLGRTLQYEHADHDLSIF
jgi:hypothetical protein